MGEHKWGQGLKKWFVEAFWEHRRHHEKKKILSMLIPMRQLMVGLAKGCQLVEKNSAKQGCWVKRKHVVRSFQILAWMLSVRRSWMCLRPTGWRVLRRVRGFLWCLAPRLHLEMQEILYFGSLRKIVKFFVVNFGKERQTSYPAHAGDIVWRTKTAWTERYDLWLFFLQVQIQFDHTNNTRNAFIDIQIVRLDELEVWFME